MKNKSRSFQNKTSFLTVTLLLLAGLFSFEGFSQTTVNNGDGTMTVTYSSSGTFTVPTGVTSVKVEAWGAGGKGGTRTGGNEALAGGGGGAYSKSTLPVTPLASYNVVVGAGGYEAGGFGGGPVDGGDSYFNNTSTLLAKGGKSVGDDSNTSGAGGSASSSVGTTKFSGGNGAIGTNNSWAGGGGSSAGTASAGNYTNTTTNSRTAATAPTGGGNGGTGAQNGTPGNDGSAPGGGGGGGYRQGGFGATTQSPGNGADGQVAITYTIPPPTFSSSTSNGTVTLTSSGTSNGTWTVPAGVKSFTVQVWGAGGGGGNSNNGTGNGGGGGGGGAFAQHTFTGVTPGTTYNLTIGTGGSGAPANSTTSAGDGGDVYFGNTTAGNSSDASALAKGGAHGINAGNGGNGGLASGSIGDIGFVFSGGNGSNSATNGGGDGGDGGNGGGNGGNGSTYSNGSDGSVPGGGGGGSDDVTNRSGGAGGDGQIVITYTLPDVSNFSVTSAVCANSTANFTINSTSLQTGTYTVSYYITGTSNSIASAGSPATATLSFTAGSPGTATFTTTSVLSVAENDVLYITQVTNNTTGNFATLTSNTNFTVSNCRAWYSYNTGNFNDYKSWTLDPSGSTFLNGLHLYPGTNDDVTILNGKTITYNVNNVSLNSTTIQNGATLDMVATTGHTLGTVTGQGLLRVKGTALPTTGTSYTDFVSTTGGTIEYYDVGGTLPTAQTTYNNLKLSGYTASATFIEASDLTVNGTFTVGTGSGSYTATWQINDNSDTQRTITLNGDLKVNIKGAITAGTGNSTGSAHNLTMYGNFTNDGVVRFFDPNATPFTSAFTSQAVLVDAGIQGNAVNVTFSGTTDQTVTCNSQTDFYHFIVDKGVSQQPILTVYSPDASYTSANNIAPYNLRLWAPADQTTTTTGSSNNALSIKNGTLKLTGTLNIPTLAEGNSSDGSGTYIFPIPLSAALWLSGAGPAATTTTGVSVTLTSGVTGKDTNHNNDQRLAVNGLFRVSDGASFDGGFSRGVNSASGGSMVVEGDNTVVTMWQFRPIVSGSGVFTYQQTGGTVNVGTSGTNGTPVTSGADDGLGVAATDIYARFSLANTNSVFQMSGGTLNIGSPTSGSSGASVPAKAGGLDIQSASGNYNVTGGTINMYIPQNATVSPASGSHDFTIYSTAPLYNVNIYKDGTTVNRNAVLKGALTVLNNLYIDGTNAPTLNCNNNDLTIGGNFTVNSGATFNPGYLSGSGGLTGINQSQTGYSNNLTSGTTTGVSPNANTGMGTGALFTTVISNGGGNKSITITSTSSGSGYQAGDVLHFYFYFTQMGNTYYYDISVTIGSGNITTIATSNTITFNTSTAATWTNNGTISSLVNVVMNKPSGTLALAGSSTFPNITGATVGLTLTSGTLNDGGKTLTVTNALSNSAIHVSGTGGSITYSKASGLIAGNNGTFGNLILTASNSVYSTNGKQTVTGNLQLNGATTKCILNIGSNNLMVNGTISAASLGIGANAYILTSGLHNAGGLTLTCVKGVPLTFPVASAYYTPNTITVNTATTTGTITVIPVNREHPNVTQTGQSLKYYWRVISSGFTGLGTASGSVVHFSYVFNAALMQNPTVNYVAARYDRSTNTWGQCTKVFNTVTPGAILPASFNTGSSTNTWTGVTGDQLDGEYTCGNGTVSGNNAFGAVTVYYSRTTGNWNTASTWSNVSNTGAVASTTPCSTCPVIVGDGTLTHTVTIPNGTGTAQMCGSLTLNANATIDCNRNAYAEGALGFGTNTTSVIGGTGTLRVELFNGTSTSSATSGTGHFPSGDFTSFIGSGGGTVEYYGTSTTAFTIPSTYISPASNSQSLTTYYNLIVSPATNQTITLPNSGLTIYNNLTQGSASGYTGTVVTNGSQTISITGNLAVSYGTFNFSNANPSITTLTVNGNATINSGATMQAQSGGTANVNTFTVWGNITNNGTINFNNTAQVNLTLTGTNNITFSGSGATTLSLVTVNMGTSQTPTVTCSLSGALSTTAVAGGWLMLTNGTFDFEYTGTSTPIVLSTSSYTIPVTAKLKVGSGTVQVTNTSGGSNDLSLNGTLEVAGGALYTYSSGATGSDNDIEYASAGTPTIAVSGGSLTVDGSIRRSTSTLTGALVYNQTGGTVTVGGNGATSTPNNTRGVFEIDANAGSEFTMIGTSVLNVQRQNGGTSYADVFINPITSTVDPTSTINAGLSTTSQSNFRVNVVPTVGNFTVVGTNAQTVNLYHDLSVGGTLTISSPSSLITTLINPDANVTIAGDFICPTGASYTGGTNTTTFNGSGAQSAKLTTTTQLYDVTVNKSGGTVTVSGTAPASPGLDNLNILSGTLEVGNASNTLSGTLQVNRNITINGSQTGTQAIEVYSTTGISNTITSSNGAFTNLTLGGTVANQTVNVSGNLTINGTLNLLNTANGATNRYLNIGSGQLTFGSTAPSPSNTGSTAFIRTNGVASDLGVVKTWANNGTFVYAVGTSSNYTPVSYSLNVTNAGTLTVVPVNSAHPTYNKASAEQILNYYWTVKRSGSLNATASGNFTFNYLTTMLSGTGGTLAAAYLDPNSSPLGWAMTPATTTGGTVTTSQMTFASTPTTNFPAAGSYYDYSVGTSNTLPNPIAPVYSRTDVPVGGDWTTSANWTWSSTGVPTGPEPVYSSAYYQGPYGLPVVILPGTQINLDTDGQVAYKTTINGVLYNASTAGHNLGIISGTGTFRTATGTFPAGVYDDFVAPAPTGGTIEYAGTTTMNSRTTYNNLKISSDVNNNPTTVTMTAANISLNGTLTVGAGNTLDDSQSSSHGDVSIAQDFSNGGTFLEGASNVSIAGNLTNTGTFTDGSGTISLSKDWSNTGTFNAGTGKVTFNGTAAQTVNGNNTFNNLTINQTGGVTLSGTNSTTVNGVLTLTSGNIISSTSNELALSATATASGGSASSYVSGPMKKTLSSGSFTAPVGGVNSSVNLYRPVTIANPSASDTWSFEYKGNNPSTDTYNNLTMNTADIQTVSQFEYWVIKPSSSTSGDLTLSYGSGSYAGSSIIGTGGDLTHLRIGHWDGAQWDLPVTTSGTYSQTQTGSTAAGTVTVTGVNDFSPFTFASIDATPMSTLPVRLISFTGKAVNDVVQLDWKTATETNNNYFEVLRSTDGTDFESIGKVKGNGTTNVAHSYSLTDRDPALGKNYYRLKQVDFDGKTTSTEVILVNVLNIEPSVSVYPNPVSSSQLLNVKFSGLQESSSVELQMYNMQGVKMLSSMVNTDAQGTLETTVAVTNLSAGLYILSVQNVYVKIIVE